MRRPAAPHLRPGRPGAPAPQAPPAPQPPQAPLRSTPQPSAAQPSAPQPARAPMVAPATETRPRATPAPPPLPTPPDSPVSGAGRTGHPGRTRRRAVLLVGAAAAVGGVFGTAALLRREGGADPSAASSRGPGSGDADSSRPFADVPADDPGAEAMRWAHETGVQPARTPADYAPHTAVTRGDVAMALHRLAGAPAVDLAAIPTLFTDLGEEPAQVTALLWMHGRGALWGDAEMRVRPTEPATRDCAAMMLAALMRPALAGVGVTWDASAGASLPELDGTGAEGTESEGTPSALSDVAWLQASGMATSVQDSADRDGAAGVTRADLAVSLHRANAVVTQALG